MKQKKQQSLIFVRVIATFLFTLFKVEINFSLQLMMPESKGPDHDKAFFISLSPLQNRNVKKMIRFRPLRNFTCHLTCKQPFHLL